MLNYIRNTLSDCNRLFYNLINVSLLNLRGKEKKVYYTRKKER